MKDKLHTGDVLQVTEAVRDLAWRRNHQGNLATQGKRIFEEGMRILSGEVAAARGVDMSEAEAEINDRLAEILALTVAM